MWAQLELAVLGAESDVARRPLRSSRSQGGLPERCLRLFLRTGALMEVNGG